MTSASRAAWLVAAALGTTLLTGCSISESSAAPEQTLATASAGSNGSTASSSTSLPETASTTAPSTSTSDTDAEEAGSAPMATDSAEPEPTTPDPNETATSFPTTTATAEVKRNLELGTKGEDVRHLQQALIEKGFWLPGADGNFGSLTQQAVFAAQKTYGLGRDGSAGPKTMKALKEQFIPAPKTSSGKAIEIDIAKQTLTLVDEGKIVAILNTSTGNGEKFESEGVQYVAVTPTGEFQVKSANPNGWVEGPLGKMYKPAYFNGGIAFHGSESIPPFPASHGCARLSRTAADMVWEKGYASVGTKVVVK